jgi:hypothetical protein
MSGDEIMKTKYFLIQKEKYHPEFYHRYSNHQLLNITFLKEKLLFQNLIIRLIE